MTARLTISMPDDLIAAVRNAGDGNVSAFATRALRTAVAAEELYRIATHGGTDEDLAATAEADVEDALASQPLPHAS